MDYKECLNYLKKIKEYEEEYNSFFSEHEMIEIIYENLMRDVDQETRKVQEFLGIEVKKLKSCLRKDDKKPLSQSIANYWKLKEKFKDTEFKEFFED